MGDQSLPGFRQPDLDVVFEVTGSAEVLEQLNGAARAAEHGRGFTVVAQEVRKLAENCTSSADQISGILRNIEDSVAAILLGIEETSGVIQRQAAVTQEVASNTQGLGRTAEQLSSLAAHLASLG